MSHRFLTFFAFGLVGLAVLILFAIGIRPVSIPPLADSQTVPGSLQAPTVTFVNPSKGASNPEVILVEFGDFQCAACRTLAQSLDDILMRYPDRVQAVWKDLPNESVHPMATPAAVAAHCAAQQQKFWEYHDFLFERQAFLSEQEFLSIARELGLNMDRFQTCYENQDTLPIVRNGYEEAVGLGLIATPTLFVNETPYVGSLSNEELLRYVQQALAE